MWPQVYLGVQGLSPELGEGEGLRTEKPGAGGAAAAAGLQAPPEGRVQEAGAGTSDRCRPWNATGHLDLTDKGLPRGDLAGREGREPSSDLLPKITRLRAIRSIPLSIYYHRFA